MPSRSGQTQFFYRRRAEQYAIILPLTRNLLHLNVPGGVVVKSEPTRHLRFVNFDLLY